MDEFIKAFIELDNQTTKEIIEKVEKGQKLNIFEKDFLYKKKQMIDKFKKTRKIF